MPEVPTYTLTGDPTNSLKTIRVLGLPIPFPGYVSGKYYLTLLQPFTNATAFPTNGTKIYFYAWTPFTNVTLSAFYAWTATGQSGGKMKIGVWGNLNGRPTGVQLAGSNSDTALTSSTNLVTINLNAPYTFIAGVTYWIGVIVAATSTLPTLFSINAGIMNYAAFYLGLTTPQTNIISCRSVTFAYAGDITVLDLTSATINDEINVSGIPILYFKAP